VLLNSFKHIKSQLTVPEDFLILDTRNSQIKIFQFIIHQIFSLACDWFKRVTWLNIPLLKLANIWEYSPIFETARAVKNIWRIINTIVSTWLWKYARIFVLGHYLFLYAHSFPQALLLEICLLLRTDNVHGQISEHIFMPNGGYCLCIHQHLSY